MKTRILAAALLISSSSFALAASQEEADGIKAAWQAYLGTTPGVVDVKVDGEAYVVTIDIAPLAAQAPQATAKLDPVVLKMAPKGNGQWDVSQSGPYKMSFTAPDGNAVDLSVSDMNWSSVYDSASAAFLTSTYEVKGITMNQTIVDPSGMKSTAVSTVANYSGTGTSVPNASGGVDGESTISATGFVVSSKSEGADPAVGAMLDYNIVADTSSGKSTFKNLRSKQLLDLVAFFVANPSKELILSKQPELKQKIEAALPLWDNVDGTADYENINIGTAMGQFAIGSLGIGATMNGAVKQGLFREAFSVKSLALPPGIAPPWTDGLIPTDVNLDFTFDGFDMETPAKMAIQQADFAKDPPISEEQSMLFLPAFAPTNSIGMSFKDGLIASPTFSITFDGTSSISLSEAMPTAKFNIRMTGMEEVIAKVQAAAASDPNAQGAMGALVAAKGFGKAEADGSLLWAIDFSGTKLLINGVDLSSMVGLPPAQ